MLASGRSEFGLRLDFTVLFCTTAVLVALAATVWVDGGLGELGCDGGPVGENASAHIVASSTYWATFMPQPLTAVASNGRIM